MIKSSFGFAMPAFDPAHRLYANELAGGGILDVGCYPVSMARLIAGAAAGKPFLDPVKVAGVAQLGETGRRRVGRRRCCAFPNGIIAEVSCSVSLAAGERAAGPRHRGADRGRRLLVRLRPRGRRRPHRDHPAATARRGPSRWRRPAGSIPSRPTRRREAIRAGRQEFARPGHELGRHARQHARARQVAGRRRPRLRHRAGRGAAAHARATRRSRGGPSAIPRRALAGLERPASRAGARLRGLPRLRRRRRSCSTPSSSAAATSSTPPGSTAAAAPRRCSASGCARAACATRWWSSARARTRR